MDFSALKNFMDRLTAWRMPGNCVRVCLDGEEVFSYCSGYADVESRTPMTPDKMFNIYSCSKVATVTAALQLYEQGFFLLDDPLYDFIPEFKNMHVKNEDGSFSEAKNPITLRHLFTMTSGFSYRRTMELYDKARKLSDGKMDNLTVAKCISEEYLEFEPGTKWCYGISHDLLATVVEVISGMKFRDYMKKNIFEPLEMKNICYHNENIQDKMATQYRYKVPEVTDIVDLQAGKGASEGWLEVVDKNLGSTFHVDYGIENDIGGAGITTTVEEYSKLVTALSLGGTSKKGEKILSRGTVDLMRTNQLTEKQLENFSWKQLKGYGYGLGVRTLIDKAASGTTGNLGEFGWGGAAGATVLVDPDIKLSVFYAHHMLNPHEEYYQPRLRNVVYNCINK